MFELSNSNLKINHLRLISAISEFGRITTAADTMLITQPAASRLLAEMERILGAKLCERHAKGMELTLYGRSFARRARNILIQMHDIPRDIEELKSGKGGTARVGAVTGAAVGYVVPAVQQLKASSPGTEIDVSVAASNDLVRGLLAGNFDFVLGRVPTNMSPHQFDIFRARTEKIDLIVRKDHPLSSAKSVSFGDLTHYEWVMQSRGNPVREVMETKFLDAGFPSPVRVTNTSSLLVMIAILANSTAISPIAREVSELLIEDTVAAKLTTLFIDQDIEVEPYNLMTVRGRQLSPTARHLKELVLLDLESREV